jgi:hypothetical protein
MNINILINTNSEEKANIESIYRIEQLVDSLKIDYNFSPKIVGEISGIATGTYYLFFKSINFRPDPAFSKNVILMNAVLGEFLHYINKYGFAAIVRSIHYFDGHPLICGKKSVADALGLETVKMLGKDYCYIYGRGENTISLLVKYLIAYDKTTNKTPLCDQ